MIENRTDAPAGEYAAANAFSESKQLLVHFRSMHSIPSGKGLPELIPVPHRRAPFVVRPCELQSTSTIRRSIALAKLDLVGILATCDRIISLYDLHPIAETLGRCIGLHANPLVFEGRIRLSQDITYNFVGGKVEIDISGEVYPPSIHGFHGRPVTDLIKHPLLDETETIMEILVVGAGGVPGAPLSGTTIRLRRDLVPVYPDIWSPAVL